MRRPSQLVQQLQQQQQQRKAQDEEDIDIVGDGGKDVKSAANTSGSSDSSVKGDSVQNSVVYGPPQFTEADVLACVAKCKEEEEEEEAKKKEGEEEHKLEARENGIKKEMEDEEGEGKEDSGEEKEKKNGEGDEVEGKEEKREKSPETVENLKAKLRAMEDSSKCSKCLVRYKRIQEYLKSLIVIASFFLFAENSSESRGERGMLAHPVREVLAPLTGEKLLRERSGPMSSKIFLLFLFRVPTRAAACAE